MGKSVRLSDIARELGVSIVTVSNALSGKKGVSEELRAKIQSKAEEMNYVKTFPSAESKENRESYNIGVLVSEKYLGRTTSFYWELYQGFTKLASKRGSITLLEVLSIENENSRTMPGLLRESKMNGLVIIGRIDTEYLEMLHEKIKVPMVFLDFYDESISCDAIVSDNFYGMYRMTQYLIENGHKNIAYVGEILATSSIMDRYLGYMKAMLENGITPKEEWLISDRNLETGQMRVKLPNVLPTAFVCNCDVAAELLIEQLNGKAIEVPEQISVVGYDNFTYSHYIRENLTTYDVDIERLARECFHLLVKRIKKPVNHKGIRIVEGSMLVRRSVRKI